MNRAEQALRFLLFFAVVHACGCRQETTSDPQAKPKTSKIQIAQQHLHAGRFQKSLESAQSILVAKPDDVAALRVISKAQASLGQYREAADTAVTISGLSVPNPSTDLLQAFDWRLRSGDFSGAETALRQALNINASDITVHRTLAQLLNAQGRRYEASRHVLVLAKEQQISGHELLSLVDLASPFDLVSFGDLTQTDSASLFDLGKARYVFAADSKPEEALEIARQLAKSFPDNVAVAAFHGRLLAETGASNEFTSWIKDLPTGIQEHPEYWSAMGGWMVSQQREEEAVRAFGEALRRNPTDRYALRSLSESLGRLGRGEEALRARETLSTLDKIFRISSSADPAQAFWISEQLQALVRPWESLAWFRHGLQLQGNQNARSKEINEWRDRTLAWESKGSEAQIQVARLNAMIGFDFKQFPLPASTGATTALASSPPSQEQTKRIELVFRDVAKQLGIETSFVSDYSMERPDFYLYQANGGGIAVLDFDLDGRPDLYFVQSGGDPQKVDDAAPNQLFRQLPNQSFTDLSRETVTDDRGFGQGVSAGDVNQDGFPDLLIANIGFNSLYLNQGDGTFRKQDAKSIGGEGEWTSSVAIADLDGDSLPEIIEVNYLSDPTIFERPCVGKRLDCTPQRFRAALDRIRKNNGDGTFSPWSGANSLDELPNFGFGVVVANFDRKHGNDVFISNDGDLNHYWRSGSQDSHFVLEETAGSAGCNIGTNGISQACMGIASGDVDRNGLLDLVITNFHEEPLNLFLQNDAGFFTDDAAKFGLVKPCTDVLGFGTQAGDFDNDGWLDLAVLNGHIYDARYADIPFKMASQLFHGGPRGFALQRTSGAKDYWNREQLARTLVMIDFNRDGKLDLVANHLDQPMAVLQNESAAQNWLQFSLIGVQSERDAIGAEVQVVSGSQKWTAWQIGGDGYMCSNEPIIHIGLGESQSIDEINVHWPSGKSQVFNDVSINQRYLLVEGHELIADQD
ncbi:MAG: FG-GAP-like repeat-containing protein [Rubripirellula sp.]